MIRSALAFSALVLSLAISAVPASAQDRELLGTFRAWNAFSEVSDGNTLCYAVAIPEDTELSRRGRQRGDVYFFITTWEGTDLQNQVNVVMGYPLDEDSTPTIRIGNESFEMFGRGERAWLLDEGQTGALLNAMRRGSRMTVSGRSERGTDSSDQYSLLGATAALDSMGEACR